MTTFLDIYNWCHFSNYPESAFSNLYSVEAEGEQPLVAPAADGAATQILAGFIVAHFPAPDLPDAPPDDPFSRIRIAGEYDPATNVVRFHHSDPPVDLYQTISRPGFHLPPRTFTPGTWYEGYPFVDHGGQVTNIAGVFRQVVAKQVIRFNRPLNSFEQFTTYGSFVLQRNN